MKMRALITGALGFVGPYLAKHLDEQGLEVWCTDLAPKGNGLPGTYRTMDITSGTAIEQILKECQPAYIFHLAGQSSVAVSWKDTALTFKINILGSINILEATKKIIPECNLVLIGSGEEYGTVKMENLPINEYKFPNPQNPYSLSKYTQTQLGLQYTKAYGMKIFLIRPFNHTGPGQAKGFVIPDFASQIAEMEARIIPPIIKVGNLDAQRDFSDVRDMVKAYWLIVQKGNPGQIYNLGTGQAVPVQNILDQLLALSTIPITIAIDQAKFRPIEVPVIYADIAKVHRDTGWQPEIPLSQTLQDTLDYWRSKTKRSY